MCSYVNALLLKCSWEEPVTSSELDKEGKEPDWVVPGKSLGLRLIL